MSLDTIITRNINVLSAELPEETVLMNVEKGLYHGLTSTSREIWDQIKEPICIRDLCVHLSQSYRAPLEQVEADTLAFIGRLQEHNLITIARPAE